MVSSERADGLPRSVVSRPRDAVMFAHVEVGRLHGRAHSIWVMVAKWSLSGYIFFGPVCQPCGSAFGNERSCSDAAEAGRAISGRNEWQRWTIAPEKEAISDLKRVASPSPPPLNLSA